MADWAQDNGEPWPLGGLIKVNDPINKVQGSLLCAYINYTLDDRGRTTKLGLMHKEAFDLNTPAEDILGTDDDQDDLLL